MMSIYLYEYWKYVVFKRSITSLNGAIDGQVFLYLKSNETNFSNPFKFVIQV